METYQNAPDPLAPTDHALAAGTGYVFIGTPAGADGTGATAAPQFIELVADGERKGELDLPEDWKPVGNTSLENGIELANEGDDPEVLGSWQNPSLKKTEPTKVFSLTINLNDFTAQTFKLYYGSDKDPVNGVFTIPLTPQSQTHSLLIVAVDSGEYISFYYPKVSFIGADSITLDPSALSEIPVKATILGTGRLADGMGQISQKRKFGKPADA